ncbi:TFIIH/NER complex subunit [Malassezia sp. CBS 17886]|nr:TFIIH/NER complex subunit [Malassezia sp. CBS 17886]
MRAGASAVSKPKTQSIALGLGRGTSGRSEIVDRSGRVKEYSSSDDKCPQCKTDRYLSPRLRLLVSPCYHKMCESCIDRLFSLGPAACPECGQIVRKQQFSAQTFQDLRVEEEVSVRKRVAKLLNRRPEEFPSARAYNDYLEESEEITFNLVNKIDLEQTQARLAHYEVLNKSLIAAQQQEREQESALQAQLDEAERQEKQLRAQKVRTEQEQEEKARLEDEREVVAQLASGRSIEQVMAAREKRAAERVQALQQREREEQQRQRQFETRLHAQPSSTSAGRLSAAEVDVARDVALSDFVGAYAVADDGSGLVAPRRAPASLGGLGRANVGDVEGYVDPWLRPELVVADAAAQYRAGGYDWQHHVWRRALHAACDGLALRPAGA